MSKVQLKCIKGGKIHFNLSQIFLNFNFKYKLNLIAMSLIQLIDSKRIVSYKT